jgi:ATP-dependent helicase HrpB
MLARTTGDILVFLPGVGEIRQAEGNLEGLAANHTLLVMPLYGDMPLSEQQAVLRPATLRKVVLATNVAETSLTINGVTAVVDSGMARINRLDPELGFNRLELSRISKASAAQRAGRAGRTAPGACLRLWSEREHLSLTDFELPEIERVELSECVLQLIAWGEHDLRAFPWFEKPPEAALDRAVELLDSLGATSSGKLTDLGRTMAGLPLPPRLARLLLEGAGRGQARRAALCAALLSERPPFRNVDANLGASHHTLSDVLEQVRAIEAFAERGERSSIMGDIIPGVAKQIMRASDQLLRLLPEGETTFSTATGAQADEALLRAIMVAFPDRICKRRQAREPRGVMVGGRGVKLSEQSTVRDAAIFAAVDIVDLNRSDLSVRRASEVERAWLPESLITTTVEAAFDPAREKVVAMKRTRFCDLILEESIAGMPADIDPGTILAEAVLANFALSTLVDENARDYLARVQCLKEWLPELDLPDFGADPWRSFLPVWCCGCSSIAELRQSSLVAAIQANLTAEQIAAVDSEAPEQIAMPSGRRVTLKYESGKPPILAARIQEFFGMAQTPSIARSRVPLVLHLLAPNYRVQQITLDLGSFWKNTYPEIKKELKGRYPKHSWPDDPLKG